MKCIGCLAQALAVVLIAGQSSAETWSIISDESEIAFTATQSGSPIGGTFPVFDGDIVFDRDDLSSSAVRIVVDLGAVETAYADVAKNLVQADWFNVPDFPNAVFIVDDFAKRDDGQFEAWGSLTLRNVTQPIVVSFDFEDYGAHPDKPGWLKALMVGQATLRRTAFGVGQGDWSATDVVADEVAVAIRLSAEAQIAE